MKGLFTVIVIFTLTLLFYSCSNEEGIIKPIRVVTELDVNESIDLQLSNGELVNLKLLEINEVRGTLRNAIRISNVKVLVDGEEVVFPSGNYNLPLTVGKVQIDCPITKGYYSNTSKERWNLSKSARFRLWPKGSPYIASGTFVYPIKQEWLSSSSQMSNEPSYVDWGENILNKKIYYHSGLDFGGAEGMDEIVSATDGLVISAKNKTLEGYDDFPGERRYDVIYIIDDQGWYYRYSHIDSTIMGIEPGVKVKMGQKIAYIGKQGQSGGWVHLHFEIKNKTSSGEWGTEEGYAYIWEAYMNQYKPPIVAVARPHHLAEPGQVVLLDGSKSMSHDNKIVSYEWSLSNGEVVTGAKQEIIYDTPGEYSEVLKVTESKGNIDYDFTVVQIIDKENPEKHIPAIHAAFHPTMGIKSGQPITFLVRTFNATVGEEVWDFGDDTPTVAVKSETVDKKNFTQGEYAKTQHSFEKPGDYIVTVERMNEVGYKATAKLHVNVE